MPPLLELVCRSAIRPAEGCGELFPSLAAPELGKPVTVSRLDRPNLIRCQIGLQSSIRILAILHAKCPIRSQAVDNGLDL
jgi:hypothetical protein